MTPNLSEQQQRRREEGEEVGLELRLVLMGCVKSRLDTSEVAVPSQLGKSDEAPRPERSASSVAPSRRVSTWSQQSARSRRSTAASRSRSGLWAAEAVERAGDERNSRRQASEVDDAAPGWDPARHAKRASELSVDLNGDRDEVVEAVSLMISFEDELFVPDWSKLQLAADGIAKHDAKLVDLLERAHKNDARTTKRIVATLTNSFAFMKDKPLHSVYASKKTGVRFKRAAVVHVLAALGMERSLEFAVGTLGAPASPPRSADCMRMTPLEVAVRFNQLGTARLLVDRFGCDPRAVDEKTKHCPLDFAVCDGSVDTARWLVNECGADPNYCFPVPGIRDKFTSTLYALVLRSLNDYLETARVLLEAGAEADLGLFRKGSNGTREILETPLMHCVEVPDLRYVKLFLEHGADPRRVAQSDGSTLLHFAAGTPGNTDVLSFLLDPANEFGLDPHKRNRKGLSAVMTAKMDNLRVLNAAAEAMGSQHQPVHIQDASKLLVSVKDLGQDKVEYAAATAASLKENSLVKVMTNQEACLPGGRQEAFWCVLTELSGPGGAVTARIDNLLSHAGFGANLGDTISFVPADHILQPDIAHPL